MLFRSMVVNIHSGAEGGHFGVTATFSRISMTFWWTGLRAQVTELVAACTIYQFNKHETIATPGLLVPLHAPSGLTMDFIEKLPKSEGKDTIWVLAVDRFTNMLILLVCLTLLLLQLCLLHLCILVYKLHGFPVSIVSDRDKILTSQFGGNL